MGNACRKGPSVAPSPQLKDLFEACEENPPTIDHILPIVRAQPELVRQRQETAPGIHNGRYSLYVALSMNAPLEVIVSLVAAWPNSVKSCPFSGILPIHQAAATSSLEVVTFLANQWPDSVAKKSASGSLPLHWAVESGKLDVIRFLVERWDDALRMQDEQGLPLHRAIRLASHRSSSLEVVKYLLSAWPGACLFPCRRTGQSPLALCIPHSQSSFGVSLMSAVLQTWPAAVQDQSRNGNRVIHQAARRGSSPVLQLLCCSWPAGVRQLGPDGNLPLHCYLSQHMWQPQAPCVKFLVDLYPKSVTVKNRDGKVPIQLLRPYASSQTRDLSFFLVDRRRPLHFLCKYAGHFRWAVAKQILAKYSHAATQKDKAGWQPWQVASQYGQVNDLSLAYELLRLCPDALGQIERL